MGSYRNKTRSNILLEQEENKHYRSTNQRKRILLRMARITKHSNILHLPKQLPRKTPSKKIRIRTRQCRIPQDRPNRRHLQQIQENKSRIPPNLLSRSKPNRRMLENHKRQRYKFGILCHIRKIKGKSRRIQQKPFF